MEYLQGMDLQQLVERHGPLPAARVAYILTQVCGSLAEAHKRDIIHRDIKPSNIFLTHRGGLYDFVKVLDFGMAKQLKTDQHAGVTKPGMLFGTPRYISPESVYGTATVDTRADIYNLGAVVYFMLTGEPPFTSSSSVELLIEHVKTVPRRPSEISELTIPPPMDALVMKCLEKDPNDRFQRVTDLESAVRAVSFDDPWTQEKAEEWWELHAPEEVLPPEEWAICPETGEVIGKMDRADATKPE
jgi:serine/threonine-protein kinase